MLKKIALVLSALFLLSACGGGSGGDNDAPQQEEKENTATLNETTIVVESQRDDWVAFTTDSTWTLRDVRNDIKVGSVLLLDDDAVRVTDVREENDVTVLDIVPAEIEDVFSKLDLFEKVDFSNATFEADDPSVATLLSPSSSRSAYKAKTIDIHAQRRVNFKINKSPFTGNIDFLLAGDMNFSYDKKEETGAKGFFNVVGSVDGEMHIDLSESGSIVLPEKVLIRLRIPVPYNIVDKALNKLGVRVASIYIPVSVGAEGSAGVDVGITIKGSAESDYRIDYDKVSKLSYSGPTNTASISLTSELPAIGPDAAAKVTVSAGPFVRARPQLLILNKVASMGVDVKVGMYAKGQLSIYPEEDPYYCLIAQPTLGTSVFGFFKSVVSGKLNTKVVSGTKKIGNPYVEGECREETKVTISSPANNAEIPFDGTPIPISFSVAAVVQDEEQDPVTGDVEVQFQEDSCITQLVDKKGECNVNATVEGTEQPVTVKYLGDDNYRGSETSVNVTIGESVITNISIKSVMCSLITDPYFFNEPTFLWKIEGVANINQVSLIEGESHLFYAAVGRSQGFDQTQPIPQPFGISCDNWTGSTLQPDVDSCFYQKGNPPITSWTSFTYSPTELPRNADTFSLYAQLKDKNLSIDGFLCSGSYTCSNNVCVEQ